MKTGLSARRSTLIVVGGVPAAGVHGVYFPYSERERQTHLARPERNVRTLHMAGSEIKGFIDCCGATLQNCTFERKSVITCFNYKQNTKITVTVVLWSRVHLSADWTHQRAADVSPPVNLQSHDLSLKTETELVTTAKLCTTKEENMPLLSSLRITCCKLANHSTLLHSYISCEPACAPCT